MASTIEHANEARGLDIHADTCHPRHYGDDCDWDTALMALARLAGLERASSGPG